MRSVEFPESLVQVRTLSWLMDAYHAVVCHVLFPQEDFR